jgi:nicotinate dehydrogenase subunit B
MQTLTTVSRRQFLKTGGAVVVSFALSPALLQHGFSQSAPGNSGGDKDPSAVDSFLAIHADGTVTLFTSRVDVGTGLEMVMRQVAAEELDIPVERFTVVEGDTLLTPDHGGTGGSRGVPQGAARVRLAAATARRAILDLGAAQLKLPASDLTIADGMVRPKTGGRGVAVGSLVGDKQLELEIDSKAPLKEVAGYRVVGKPLLRPDVPAKCTGKHVYVQDLTLPGMLHARVIRPPAIGAALLSVDEASLHGIPDVRVVRIQNFLAVVAKDEWAALRASRELKAQWSDWSELPESGGFDQFMLEAPLDRDEPVASEGNFDAALPTAARQLSATYYWPFQSHASLGPSCGVADFRESGTTVWTSSQGVFGLRSALARTFAIPREKLRVIYLDGSGSYGTNAGNDASADALLLSKTLGAPVRVQWSRQDEIGWDPKGPAQLLKLRGGLGPQNNILAWESQMWLPSGPSGERALVGPESAGIPQPQGQGAGLMTMNADPPYAASNVRVTAHFLKGTPLRLSNLRAPGKIANVFAVESFTDEMAAAAGMDPVEFRLRGLKDPRAIAVIRRAAEMIGWQSRTSPNPGSAGQNLAVGRGFAYARYKQQENYVATAMEVAVNRETGEIAVRRVVCAHDCGLIMNPDGLRNQVEGNIVQTLSRTLHEEVTFDRSRVTSVDWRSYPILTFPEAPAVEVALINRPDQPPNGAGEAASVTVPGALANAIFDATGVRLRTVPLIRERVKQALQKS